MNPGRDGFHAAQPGFAFHFCENFHKLTAHLRWGRPSFFVVCLLNSLSAMDCFYRRRLPHWYPEEAILFVTWRLAGSPPPVEPDILTAEYTGRVAQDRRGPVWLQDPRVAEMVQGALHYAEEVKQIYDLYAWVVMPNHVHLLLKPKTTMAAIMRWLKGRTARVANRILGRTGLPFWQDESFDHWVRSGGELEALISYIEDNPVKAGLVRHAVDWPWSSACEKAGDKKRSPAPPPPAIASP